MTTAALHATRKLVAAVLRGDRPEEALAREANAELGAFRSDVVEVAVVPPDDMPIPRLAVTADEAVAALAPMFKIMEHVLIEIREKTGKNVMITAEAANAYINAQAVLKKAGYESIHNRKIDPLRFLSAAVRAK